MHYRCILYVDLGDLFLANQDELHEIVRSMVGVMWLSYCYYLIFARLVFADIGLIQYACLSGWR